MLERQPRVDSFILSKYPENINEMILIEIKVKAI